MVPAFLMPLQDVVIAGFALKWPGFIFRSQALLLFCGPRLHDAATRFHSEISAAFAVLWSIDAASPVLDAGVCWTPKLAPGRPSAWLLIDAFRSVDHAKMHFRVHIVAWKAFTIADAVYARPPWFGAAVSRADITAPVSGSCGVLLPTAARLVRKVLFNWCLKLAQKSTQTQTFMTTKRTITPRTHSQTSIKLKFTHTIRNSRGETECLSRRRCGIGLLP